MKCYRVTRLIVKDGLHQEKHMEGVWAESQLDAAKQVLERSTDGEVRALTIEDWNEVKYITTVNWEED